MRYWHWFFRIDRDSTGWHRFIDWWLLFHFLTAAVLTFSVESTLRDASNTVLLPLAGIFIGLCFAWGGNAQALLQTEEIELLAKHRAGGIGEYVYVYQTAILVVMGCLVLWGLAGLGIFDDTWPIEQHSYCYQGIKWLLFFVASVTLRECWHVVLGAQSLLLLRAKIRENNRSSEIREGQG